MRVLSPRIDPPDARARRVDREHRDAVARLDGVQAERLDERRLARARARRRCRRGPRPPVRREQPSSSAAASLPVVGPGRLDERDGAGQRPPVAADADRRRAELAVVTRQRGRGARGGARGRWRRRRGCSCRARRRPRRRRRAATSWSCGGITPPHTTRMSSPPAVAQLVDELRHERLVPGGLARHADHVHVVLDRGPGHLRRASRTADRSRRRSRCRRRRCPRPWRRGRGRPGPSWP